MANVVLKNVYKYYEKNPNPSVSDFNMEIDDKEFIVFVGPSGCGKSTTLRMIAGLEIISEGEIYIGDRLVNDVEPKDRDIAMVFQNYALYPHMTVCRAFNIDEASLPEVTDSDGLYGYTDFCGILPEKIPVCAVLGDSHAAFFAQGCVDCGDMKATYGTGSSIMKNIGGTPKFYDNGIATSLAFKIGGKVSYAAEGNITSTGASISWLKDDAQLINSPSETEKTCMEAKKQDGLYFVPAFNGLGAPYWRDDVRGMLIGISRNTGKNEIVRAVLESIAYSINDVVAAMGEPPRVLKTDGGPTGNSYLMQFQSDITGCPLQASSVAEMSAAGAAFAAGIRRGLYPEDIYKIAGGKIYNPSMQPAVRQNLLDGWNSAIKMLLR